eukprot:TRINITY_DN6745_c0_g1_i4.p1 TRINITY_DN6745_c0_g1~~TRINITY_DN6745_c0_g1_i4.p1  ORF type:complete len:266 (+),score=12.47 TRINITY_DN6745_c0_g1_i4:362-1159(+)
MFLLCGCGCRTEPTPAAIGGYDRWLGVKGPEFVLFYWQTQQVTIFIMFCCACPAQGSVAVVETCGKFDRFLVPGFSWVLCCVGEYVAGIISIKLQQLEVECETKTKDNVFVNLVISVQYQVQRDNLYNAFYRAADIKAQMKAYVYDAVRSAVPQLELDELYVRKTEVARIVQRDLQDRISFFGFDIVSILIIYLKPDLKVKASINESHAAAKLRIAATEIAEANKLTIIKQAEAQAHRLVLEGYGIAQQMQAIMHGCQRLTKDGV